MFRVTIFLLFINSVGYAQHLSIKGIVLVNGERKSSALVVNLQSKVRNITDLKGEFGLNVNVGDTLLTSLPGFIVDTTIYINQKYLSINLRQSVITLKEVEVTTKRISPAAKYDDLKKEYHDIYRKGDFKNMVMVSPFGIGINVDKVYNALSKEGKNARKLQHILSEAYKDDVIDSKFKQAFVAKITGLKGKELDTFMKNYRPSFEFVKNISDYELSKYIADMAKKIGQSSP